MSRHTKLKLIPSHLPAIRDRLAKMRQDELARAMTQLQADRLGVEVRQYDNIIKSYWDEVKEFQLAPLWWVSHDMFLIALDAAESHTEPRDQQAPTPSGFIYFDGDFPTAPIGGNVFPNVCALEWLEDSPGRIALKYYSRHVNDGSLPLTLVAPEHQYEQSAEFLRMSQFIVRALKATWALSSIPTISSVKLEQGINNKTKAGVQQHNHINQVKIITLREQKQSQENLIDKRTNRPYSHRFIVRGFYRNQPYGEKHQLRRKQWIPPFVKGPSDKPLIVKETVRVWKR